MKKISKASGGVETANKSYLSNKESWSLSLGFGFIHQIKNNLNLILASRSVSYYCKSNVGRFKIPQCFWR